MGRLFFLFLFVIFAVLINPTLREKARPHAQFALDPVFKWSVDRRLDEFAGDLEEEMGFGRLPPGPKEFSDFLERRYPGEGASIDPWGTAYYIKKHRKQVTVGSAGPDLEVGTADDRVSRSITVIQR